MSLSRKIRRRSAQRRKKPPRSEFCRDMIEKLESRLLFSIGTDAWAVSLPVAIAPSGDTVRHEDIRADGKRESSFLSQANTTLSLSNVGPSHLLGPHVLNPPSTLGAAAGESQNVVLLDSRLPDSLSLLRAALPGAKVFEYDSARDSANGVLSHLVDWAITNGIRIGSVSILSHGHAGAFELGDQWISTSSLTQTATAWQRLGDVLASGASIDLFGCDVAAPGSDGQLLIDRIGKLSGGAVYASTNLTGVGGDWKLETSSNHQATASAPAFSVALDLQKLASYTGTLLTNTGSWTLTGGGSGASTTASGVTTTLTFSPDAPSASLAATGNDTLNNIPAFTPTAGGDPSLDASFYWDTTPESPTTPAATDAQTGTMTVTFSKAVTNPVFNLDRLGGSDGSVQVSAMLTLLTSGVTLTRLSGTPHFAVDSTAGTITNSQVGDRVANGYTGESSMTANKGTAAGSVQLNGSFTTVSFRFAAQTNSHEGGGGDDFEMAFAFNAPPTVATPASASPGTVTGTSTSLSVLGADDGGESNLTYTWATTGTPPASVIFGANGSNSAKNTTATFTAAGTYDLLVTIADSQGASATSATSVTVSQTDSSVAVTPGTITVASNNNFVFTATAYDQFGKALASQPTFTWSVSGSAGGSVSSGGVYSAPGSGTDTLRAASGGLSATATVTVVPGLPVATPVDLSGSFNRVGITSDGTTFSGASGFDADGNAYSADLLGTSQTWSGNAYTIGAAGSNNVVYAAGQTINLPAAQDTAVTMLAAGTNGNWPNQTFVVTYTDNSTQSFTQGLSDWQIPQSYTGETAVVSMAYRNTYTGSKDSGAYTYVYGYRFNLASAKTVKSITLPNNSAIGVLAIDVSSAPAPTVATAASATPSPATGTTANLSVLGASYNGESTLTYNWTKTAGPGSVNFSANGTNAAKNTTATFSAAGDYSFLVTITDGNGMSVTSSVGVTVAQTTASVAITPGTLAMADNTSYPFSAAAFDQFGALLLTQPTIAWSVDGGGAGGSVSSGGVYSTPSSGTGTDTLRATADGFSGTAAVTVTPDGIFTSGQDVGGPVLPGYFSYNSGVYTVVGGSNNNDVVNDQFQFASTALTGDGVLIAHVASLTGGAGTPTAGIAFRTDNSASAVSFDLLQFPGFVSLQYRSVSGTQSAVVNASVPSLQWLKIVRAGDSFSAYYSSDGQTWTAVGSAITLAIPSSALVGLVSTSLDNSTLAMATFDHVTLDAPQVTPSGPSTIAIEGDIARAIDPGITVSDSGSSTLSSATVAIIANFAGAEDVLGFTNQNGITGSYDAAGGILTLSGTASLADYQAALESVTYQDTSATPTLGDRTVSFVVNDAIASSAAAAATVSVVSHATLVVTTADDVVDGDTSWIGALLNNPGSDGDISLREAITAIDNMPSGMEPTVVDFDIPGSGVQELAMSAALPAINRPVILDATSQPGYSNQPLIQISGSAAPNGADGLDINASNSLVEGFDITGFTGSGIQVLNSQAVTVFANYLGVDPTGTTASGNANGVTIIGGQGNTIGGANAADRNIISGNGEGIYFYSTSSNQIFGNYIGTDATGTAVIANTDSGIKLSSTSGNVIGGPLAGERNVISGNTTEGIALDFFCGSTTIQGNYIGINAAGNAALGNGGDGVSILGANTLIGGSLTGDGNVISGNAGDGILLDTSSANTTVAGNYIGTDATGSAAIPNAEAGVDITGADNLIGGSTAGAGNVISGNTQIGVKISGSSATGNTLEQNLIGLNAAGSAALANNEGVSLFGAPSNSIGGDQAGDGNIISGNADHGVELVGSGATGNSILGNDIGTDSTGSFAIANHIGVVVNNAPGNVIGDGTPGGTNVISGNVIGIDLLGSASTGNTVAGNLIGTSQGGTSAVANHDSILIVGGASNDTIGGTAAGDANVIAASEDIGIYFSSGASNNLIAGNFIGVDAAGDAMGNRVGVYIDGSSAPADQGNIIGGTANGTANVIADNSSSGVVLVGSNAIDTTIRGNSIYGNGGLGIDLGGSGNPLANSGAEDPSQPNLAMNYPVFTAATVDGSSLALSGSVGSAEDHSAFAGATVDVYVSVDGNGQGKTYLGSLTADGSGNFSGTLTVSGSIAGQNLTATATDGSGNTSEFSPNYLADQAPAIAVGASSSSNPVTGTTTNLSVLGASVLGESDLSYVWTTTSGSAGVSFSDNNDNAAKNVTATFAHAGAYDFLVTITDSRGVSTTSTTSLTVVQTATQLVVTPGSLPLNFSQQQQFSAVVLDQFGLAMAPQPTFIWTVQSGPGLVDSTGLYTAPITTGNSLIAAAGDGLIGTAAVSLHDVAPTVSTTGSTVAYAEGDAATIVDPNATLTADTPTLSYATVSISANYAAEDVLGFVNQNGITGAYTGGVLSLTGVSSVANYQAALRSITYVNTSADPSPATRTIDFRVNDGFTTSAAAGRDFAITPVNNAPTINAPGAQAIAQNSQSVLSSLNSDAIVLGDVDSEGAAEQLILTASHGTITLNTTANLTFTVGTGTNDTTATFTGSIADLNNALDGLTYTPTPGFSGHGSLSISLNDLGNTGTGGPQTASATVPFMIGTPGFFYSPGTFITTNAGGSRTFQIALLSQPTADVSIDLASSDTTLGTLSVSSLTFTAANWNVPQNVTVTGVINHVAAGDMNYLIHVTPAASADSDYSGMQIPDFAVTNIDTNVPQILMAPIGLLSTTVTGGTASIQLVLTSQPTSNVVIPLSSTATNEGVLNIASVVFTPSTWNTPVMVTVTGVNDHIADGNATYQVVGGPAVSDDANYGGMTIPSLTLTSIDTVNVAGVTVTPTTGLSTSQSGATTTFTAVLNSAPIADVTIPLASSDTTQGEPGVASLTFTPANWSTPQTVTVIGVNDHIARADQAYSIVTGPAASADSNYNNYNPGNVSLTNIDTNVAGISVTPISSPTTTALGGSAKLGVVLMSKPTADVTVPIVTSDSSEGVPSVAALVFTPQNWNLPQSVAVSGQNDGVSGGTAAYSITAGPATSADAYYEGVSSAPAVLSNTRNTAPGLSGALGALAYTHEGDLFPVESGLVITPQSVGNLAGASVTIDGYVPGQDTLSFTATPDITGAWDPSIGALTLSGIAPAAEYQSALRSVTYQNLSQTPSAGNRTIALQVSDGVLIAAASRVVDVQPVNSGPTTSLPSGQSTQLNTPITLSPTTGNGISIADRDSSTVGAPVRVTLSVQGGTVTLATTDALTFFTGTGTDDAALVFEGSPTAVNSAFFGMRFTPTAGFAGTARIEVTVDDLGFGGVAGSRISRASLSIQVGDASLDLPSLTPQPPKDKNQGFGPDSQGVIEIQTTGTGTPGEQSGAQQQESTKHSSAGAAADKSGEGAVLAALSFKMPPPVKPILSARLSNTGAEGDLISVDTRTINGQIMRISETLEDALAPGTLKGLVAPVAAPTVSTLVTAQTYALQLAQSPMWRQLNETQKELEEEQQKADITTGMATGFTALLSLGYVIWVMRGASLVASFLATLPAWRFLDPLPVLESWDRRRKDREAKKKGDGKDVDEERIRSLTDE